MDHLWFSAPGLIAISLLVSLQIHARFQIFQRFLIPSGLIAGSMLLMVGPDFLDFIPHKNYDAWKSWPGYLISFLFAGLILGEAPIHLSTGEKRKYFRPVILQSIFVWFIAIGQLVVGFFCVNFITGFWGGNPLLAHIIEIGWTGGHGSAAAMVAVMDELGHREIGDLGIFSATAGLILGSVTGLILVNRLKRKYKIADESVETGNSIQKENGTLSSVTQPAGSPPFLRGILLMVLAVFLAYLMREAATDLLERYFNKGPAQFVAKFPLFSFSLLFALLIRMVCGKIELFDYSVAREIKKITALVLDLLIVSAVATLNFSVFSKHLESFLILTLFALVWCVIVLLFFAPRMLPRERWLELGVLNFGMSTGVTALGLLLVKSLRSQVSPESGRIYGLAAPFSAPLIGGGLISFLLPKVTAQGYQLELFFLLTGVCFFLFVAGYFIRLKS